MVEVLAVTGRIENGRVESEPLFTWVDGEYESGFGDPRRIFSRKGSHYGAMAKASTFDSRMLSEEARS